MVFFQMVNTHVTMKKLVRVCPECLRKQIVAQREIKRKVSCNHCGADIPPPSPPGRIKNA